MSDNEQTDNEQKLPILGHLAELRTRLTRSVIAVAVTSVFSFVFYKQIFNLLTYKSALTQPVFDFISGKLHLISPPEVNLIFIDVTENIGSIMRVCLASGIILAILYLTYEFIMFVSPALTRKEKRYVYLILPWVALMFIGGVIFAYFILIPPAMRFLLTFGSEIATPQIKVGSYIAVVTRLLLVVGLIFEMPVVTTFLARIGVLKAKWLAEKRKIAFILAFIVAAVITPTIDPINQSLVAVPLMVLYEMSIWLARLVQKRKTAKDVLSSPTT